MFADHMQLASRLCMGHVAKQVRKIHQPCLPRRKVQVFMELNVITLASGARCVQLTGRMDLKGVQSIEARFNAETGATKQSVIVDMSQVQFIASIGIRLLLTNIKQLNPIGARMIFLRPQKLVDDVLRLSGIDAVAEIVNDDAEAVKLLKA